MKQGKITIESNIPEDIFMEGMLNQYHSGYDISLLFLFYAFAHSWHINKLGYYKSLMEGFA